MQYIKKLLSNKDIKVSKIATGVPIGTDMESSALFAFGLNRRIRVASVSVLSDEICDSGDEYKGLSDKDIWFKKVLPMMPVAFESIVSVTNGLIEKGKGAP